MPQFKLKNRQTQVILMIIVIVGAVYFLVANRPKNAVSPVQQENDGLTNLLSPREEKKLDSKNQTKTTNTQSNTQTAIKDSVLLSVPFTSQAPLVVWDDLHNEACEEASVIMVAEYLSGNHNRKLEVNFADQQIIKMVNWEINKLGSHKDLTAEETVRYLAIGNLGYKNAHVHRDFSIDNIKRELSAGKPVVIPMAGMLLGNPNFRQPGPVYHMLVIKGYNSKYFITNDPGTRKGESYKYLFSTIEKAAHNWAGTPDKIESGAKVYLTLN